MNETGPGQDCHDIVVVSDMHLGEGRPRGAHRYSPTDDFFHDASFARFLEFLTNKYAQDPSALVLVLMEIAAGIFVLEMLGITNLFPQLDSLSSGKRKGILGVAFVGLLLLASIESS